MQSSFNLLRHRLFVVRCKQWYNVPKLYRFDIVVILHANKYMNSKLWKIFFVNIIYRNQEDRIKWSKAVLEPTQIT